jgi:hypothetical protein
VLSLEDYTQDEHEKEPLVLSFKDYTQDADEEVNWCCH